VHRDQLSTTLPIFALRARSFDLPLAHTVRRWEYGWPREHVLGRVSGESFCFVSCALGLHIPTLLGAGSIWLLD